MARPTGFEPVTYGLEGRCSTGFEPVTYGLEAGALSS